MEQDKGSKEPAAEPGAGPQGGETPTIRSHLLKLWRSALGALGGMPRAIALVWRADKGFTLGLAACTILAGFVPAATAWISKLLIDEVVVSIRQGFGQTQMQTVIWLALAQVAS